ncbi:MAG: hypothetical protein AB7V26_01600 [Lysobacterales bacterium]
MTRKMLAITLLLGLWSAASAYEIGTHALVTQAAVGRSVLSSTHAKSIVPVLGFERLDANRPFEAAIGSGALEASYFDNQPLPAVSLASIDASAFQRRVPQPLERTIFTGMVRRGLVPGNPLTTDFEQRIQAWVMRGAVREDDNDVGTYSIGDRDDDPWNVVFRAGRHFYDPINNRGLDQGLTCFTFGCRPAIDWAMGRTDVLNGPGSLDTGRENHFSWQDARDNYWWALTYNLSIPEEMGFSLTHGEMQGIESGFRKFRFATTLKSVGQVIHLLQDTAQPQHTRNDSHGPPAAQRLTGDGPADGAFEAYTEARLFGVLDLSSSSSPLKHFDGTPPLPEDLPPLKLSGAVPYPVPSFRTPVQFFTTRHLDTSRPDRRGLADLSNRGFFTASTLPNNVEIGTPDSLSVNFRLFPPLPEDNPAFYEQIPISTAFFFQNNTIVQENALIATMPDVLAPNWNQQSGLFNAYSGDGRMPLLSISQTSLGDDLLSGTPLPGATSAGQTMSYEVFTAQADALLPRAVAYSTGLIDYFFRGRLEVTPTAQKVFAVLNQGELHSMDAEGYPRRPDGRIFGFEKLRLNVRNVSEAIIESGPVAPALPQTSGDGVLVAVARFHRNTCYQPDLSGERLRDFAPPPSTGTVTEPSCPPDTTPRTGFQEIAVSAPLTIASVADLPGGEGVAGPALPVEKVFDFSADPIPVNATDLFIQVVYRGALGEEPDGIALGSYDVREPAFVGIWNNTDYYWNVGASQWVFHLGGLFPFQNADFLRVCTGAAADSRFAWFGEPVAGAPILGVPVPNPGVVRLAMLFAIPASPTQQFSVRVTPVMNAPTPSAPQRSWFTRGAIHQAGRESIPAAMLATPLTCADNPAATTETWCQQPVERRRGQAFGQLIAPVLYDTSNGNITPPDVDAPPALPTFPGVRVAETGTLRYNDAVLAACPPPPTQNPEAEALIELLETAADLGIPID